MISTPMLISAATGFALLVAVGALFYLVSTRKPAHRHMSFHRAFAWTLGVVAALHGVWGLVAVFVLRS